MNTTQLAERIQQCKFLLVACGAGFSADSGLPVYADVANVPTYKELDLKYHDLARPSTMLDGEHQSDAELFFGFWGGCTNLYRETLSHEGYSIVKRWRDELDSQCTLEFKQYQVEFLKNNYGVDVNIEDVAGPLFVYTSNVDAHFHRFLPESEIYEIHGNVEKWQCQTPCSQTLTTIPYSHRFIIQPNKRMNLEQPFTRCLTCNAYMRPNVMMFGDVSWIPNTTEEQRYVAWEAAVEHFTQKASDFVILEMGCGSTVPSVHLECEEVFTDTDGKSTWIVINVDENPTGQHYVKDTALHALKSIDDLLHRK